MNKKMKRILCLVLMVCSFAVFFQTTAVEAGDTTDDKPSAEKTAVESSSFVVFSDWKYMFWGANLPTRVSQEYGGTHKGIDITDNAGGPSTLGRAVYSVCPGTVTQSVKSPSAGEYIAIRCSNRNYTIRYLHLQERVLNGAIIGATVTNTSFIGKVGYTGQVSPAGIGGTHLHLDINNAGLWDGGGINMSNTYNPRYYFSEI